ncbi:MAG: hypothetical protein ACI870_000371 [Crocinitomicaceae bacterium]|jgi:hypothetical protein
MPKKNTLKLEHIDRLSRGKKSGINIGSRAVAHHLHNFEREIYERSLKKGYLDIDERSRDNLSNLWEKVCIVKGWQNIILIKNQDRTLARILINGKKDFEGSVQDAKIYIKNCLI